MEALQQMTLSLIGVSLICGILLRLLPGGPMGTLLRLVCGGVLLTALLGSLCRLELPDVQDYLEGFSADAQAVVEDARAMAEEERQSLIKAALEAYILERAGDALTVEVRLDRQGLPESVQVWGNLSPRDRQQLGALITNDLGIPEENQQWTEENKGN